MANYTKTTDFAAKDTLPGGDTNKVVRGTEFETEFDAISTAISTKSDTSGPTFTGTVTVANLTATGTINFNGATISNLGTITTANLDGGTIDNAVIGGSTAAAGSFTTVAASSSITVGGTAVLTSVAFSNIDASAITTSSETFADSDTQIPTNAAVKDHVEAVIPTLSVTESSVTAHQAALAIAATQLTGNITVPGNVRLSPSGTNFTELFGNTNPGTIRFNCESNSHGVTVQGPAHSAASTYTVKLPDTLGLTQASGIVTSDANGVVSFDNGTIEEVTTVTSSSNAATINLRDGNLFEHDLTENVTYTFSNPAASGRASSFVLKVIQDSSARTITWPGSVDWPAATAPTLTATNNGVDVFVFFTIDGGTTYYGFVAGQALG